MPRPPGSTKPSTRRFISRGFLINLESGIKETAWSSINLSVELAKREYVNGNRQQLEWAINYLEANYQANFADNDEHGSIDWMVRTSSLDPEERVVTQHL
eukprot:SAG22_NODE_49_length_24620_cov_80.053587_9_plen_100_part_00